VIIAAVLAVGSSMRAGDAGGKLDGECARPTIKGFLWVSDKTEGIALTYTVANPVHKYTHPAFDLRLTLTLAPKLAEHWEVEEAVAYYQDGGRRRSALREGPTHASVERSDEGVLTYSCTLESPNRPVYEIDLLLRKVKEGMSIDKVRTAIRAQEAVTLGIEPSTIEQNHDPDFGLSRTDGASARD
jgi:hypothetical protein